MRRRHRAVAAATIAALALVATACGSSTPRADSQATSDPTTEPGLTFPAPTAGGDFPAVDQPPTTGELAKVSVKLTEVATLDSPTDLVSRPGHPNQLWVTERAGRILVANRSTDGTGKVTFASTPLLDWRGQVATDGEEGMLGLAFDPTGKTLYFTSNLPDGDTRLSKVSVTDTPSWPELGKPTTVLTVDQPETTNHKGGDLTFGPDGFLYLGLGDGGGQGDPDQRAQDRSQPLGKLLRIDPAKPAPNVWLTGLRNPWRFSFDPATRDLWIGDVGQNEREEIDRLPFTYAANANLGWSGYEGTKIFKRDRRPDRSVPPVYEELLRDGACAITGGVVYRGQKVAALDGAYLLSDLCKGGIRALRVEHDPADPGNIGHVVDHAQLLGTDGASQVISFGTDADGEVYALGLQGQVWRLDPA